MHRRPRRIGGLHSYPDKHVIVAHSRVFPLSLLIPFSLLLVSGPIDSVAGIIAVEMESEAFEDLQKGGGALRTIKDLSAGAAGGVAQVLLGMFMMSPEVLRDEAFRAFPPV